MGEHQRALIELMERPWSELGPAERQLFEEWCDANQGLMRGVNLYLLLEFARSRWRKARTSSSQTFEAITDSKEEKK